MHRLEYYIMEKFFHTHSYTNVTRDAGNANSSGAPSFASFSKSSFLHWVFTGLIYFTNIVCYAIYD